MVILISGGILTGAASLVNIMYNEKERNNLFHADLNYRLISCEKSIEKIFEEIYEKQDTIINILKRIELNR